MQLILYTVYGDVCPTQHTISSFYRIHWKTYIVIQLFLKELGWSRLDRQHIII